LRRWYNAAWTLAAQRQPRDGRGAARCSHRYLLPASRAEVEADTQRLYHFSFDGITLIDGDAENARYTILDLSEQNVGTDNPLNGDLNGKPNQ
jgi:hypothetical protein